MPAVVEITDGDVVNAERILLPQGKTFDAERCTFIKSLDTLDLRAVPGSGKTTAVLAKLIALNRHLPLRDGSGILAISHTNVAVDQIKSRLGPHCPELFTYPSFVGTIQAFVDKFLAIPYYVHRFGRRPVRVDNEIYSERTADFSKVSLKGHSGQDSRNAKHYLNCYDNASKFRFARSGEKTTLLNRVDGKPLVIKKPRSRCDWSEAEKTSVVSWLTDFKKQVMHDGFLCYDDAYYLADCLLSEVPAMKVVMQGRFSYVFVDEMQDMGKHQHDLLERLFYDDGKSTSVYQRIGDRNQGIQGSVDFDVESAWKDRPNVLTLENSCRLSGPIARVTQPFAVHDSATACICGLGESEIRPHLLTYDDSSRTMVLHEFAVLLKSLIVQGKLPDGDNAVFKAVAWNAEWPADENGHGNKVRLTDYHPAFRKTGLRPAIDHSCLGGYLTFSSSTAQPYRGAYVSVLNLFLKVLRLEGVRNPIKDCHFTAMSLRRYLHENHPDFYEVFLMKVHRWMSNSIKQKPTGTEDEVKSTLLELLRLFGKGISLSRDFVNGAPVIGQELDRSSEPASNTYAFDGITILLSTVHGVKGETHTATLYLESYYHEDGHGESAKSYESQRLAPQFLGTPLSGSEGKRTKQSAKMVYVGFSRPTHLLCVAVHKDRFDKYLTGLDRSSWEIIELPKKTEGS